MNKAAKIALGIGAGAAILMGFNALSSPTSNQSAPDPVRQEYENRDYDCGDFSTRAEAQAFFEAAGNGDPHRLDRDSDGSACETLP